MTQNHAGKGHLLTYSKGLTCSVERLAETVGDSQKGQAIFTQRMWGDVDSRQHWEAEELWEDSRMELGMMQMKNGSRGLNGRR